MSLGNDVKREVEAKLSEVNENKKYLYSRVMELEKRNQKLEKKVKKLEIKKKELKKEVLKLRRKTVVQHLTDDHAASTSDVQINGEFNFGSVPSSHDEEEEQAVNTNVNSDSVDETTSKSNDADQIEENRESTVGRAVQGLEFDNSEDNPSRTGSSAVQNQCPQCSKGFSTAWNLSNHIKSVHGPKKECNFCHKMYNSAQLNRHVREAHMGDTRECPECKKQIKTSNFSAHMREVHLGFKRKSQCLRCGKLKSRHNLKSHIKGVHD